MNDTISEKCRCGASTEVPVIASGIERAHAIVKDWRENHRCDDRSPSAPSGDTPPRVDTKGSAYLDRAPRWDFDRKQPVRLGFQPNGEA